MLKYNTCMLPAILTTHNLAGIDRCLTILSSQPHRILHIAILVRRTGGTTGELPSLQSESLDHSKLWMLVVSLHLEDGHPNMSCVPTKPSLQNLEHLQQQHEIIFTFMNAQITLTTRQALRWRCRLLWSHDQHMCSSVAAMLLDTQEQQSSAEQ